MKKIRLGVFGTRRGMDFRRYFLALGCEFVALCDNRPHILEDANKQLGGKVATYDKFEDFIEHDMDAVIIANNFQEHVPYVIECFKRNLHVFSECTAAATMAECVELVRAFKNSKSIYFLAENYPQMIVNMEMSRIVKEGTLGKILYAEGEYNHPSAPDDKEFLQMHVYNLNHWRNYLPTTYYVTHSLGPLIEATGAMPKKVSAHAIFEPYPADEPHSKKSADRAGIIVTENNDGSVFRFVGCSSFGAHHNAYRYCGVDGSVENIRSEKRRVLLRYNKWSIPEGMKEVNDYVVEVKDKDAELINSSWHDGGDFITARLFTEYVRAGKQPPAPFDIYGATTMSSVGILAWRSILDGGKPYEIPDFSKEEDCKKWENDNLTPFPAADGSAPTLPCCSNPDFKLSEKNIEEYLKLLK